MIRQGARHFNVRARAGIAILAAAALLTPLAACGGGAGAGEDDGVFKIVTGFYPLEWLAKRVAGGDATVQNLTKPGTEPHDLELTPRQVLDIAQADFAFYLKGVQPALDKAVDQHAKNRSLDAASLVKTLPGTGQAEPEHGDGPALAYDPHLWLDPPRFAGVATALGERLAKADPAHAAGFRARAQATVRELTALDGEFRTGLRQCRGKTIVTGHAAFGYLTSRYGLEQVGVTGIDPHTEPSQRRLAELTKLVKDKGITTVFLETNASAKTAQTLATETGVKTATLNPVESPPTGQDYLSTMRKNLVTLRIALGCP